MDIYAAAGIVFDDRRRLLLIRRGREPAALTWSVPGGKCLPGETAEAACVRELAEETGLLVRVERLAGRINRLAPGGHRFVIDDFVCTEVGWFDRASFERMLLASDLATTLAGWQLLPD